MAKDLFFLLVSDHQLVLSYSSPLSSVLELLSSQFRSRQDQLKFDVCQLLTDVLVVTGKHVRCVSDVWLASVAEGLYEILQSKLGM